MLDERRLKGLARYPLAARLDEVLGAIHDAHVAMPVDRGDVSGAEPAPAARVGGKRSGGAGFPRSIVRLLGIEIAVGRPWAVHLQLSRCGAVTRCFLAIFHDAAHLAAGNRKSLCRASEAC